MENTRLRDCSLFRLAVFVVLPVLIVLYTCNKGSYYSAMACTFAINVLLAASLNLVNGFSGMFSMGHAAFMAVGAYISAFLTLSSTQKASMLPGLPQWLADIQIPLLPALLVAGLAAAFVAVLIGIPVLRFKGHYLSVATLGLIVIVRAVLDNSDSVTNGPRGITGLPNLATPTLIFAVLMVSLFIMYRIIRSSYGRGLIAMRDDDVAAQSRQYRTDTDPGLPPLEGLSEKFSRMDHCSVLYDVDKKRADLIVETAKRRDVKGVIVALTKFCDPEEFDYPLIKKACEKAGLPVALIEIDRQMVNCEQARTQLEAFRDILQERKIREEKRKWKRPQQTKCHFSARKRTAKWIGNYKAILLLRKERPSGKRGCGYFSLLCWR